MTLLCRIRLLSRKFFRLWIIVPFCLLIGLSNAVQAQAAQQTAPAEANPAGPGTLAEFLAQVPWNPREEGPLLVIDPDGVRRDKEVLTNPMQQFATLRAGLPVFHRSLFRVGSLTAIAPAEMVQLEDKPNQPPNFYDGLPRHLKVKYLLATLNADQWRQLNKDGLGLGDLNEDQRKVFQSLLPDPFCYHRYPLDANGYGTGRDEKITLAPRDRQQVRLRVFQKLELFLPLLNEAGSSVMSDFSRWPGQPNGYSLRRDASLDDRAAYGVSFRAVVPNRLKPGELNYRLSTLSAAVSLQDVATVQDLISRIAAATHLEIHADLRVAHLPVLVRGSRARAGDLLQALALAVTGTYRAVDGAYVLSGDLVGLGTRQWRVAEWQQQVEAQIRLWADEVTAKIAQASGRNGGINTLGFAPNEPYTLPPNQIAEAWRRDRGLGGEFTVETLPIALQQLIHDIAERSPESQKTGDTRAEIKPVFMFAYQLPGGDLLDPEGTRLGDTAQYQPHEPSNPGSGPAKPRAVPAPGPLPLAEQRLLFVTPTGATDVEKIVPTARRAGFTDLVLNTEDTTLLLAAIHTADQGPAATRLRVHACVAPFNMIGRSETLPPLPDRNINGETAAEVVAARKKLARWPNHLHLVAGNIMPLFIPERVYGVGSALAPAEPGLTARFRRIATLAQTAGLAGLYLYDTQPAGYAGQRHQSISIANYDGPLIEQENLGYAPPLRLAFLRQYGVDPLDLIPPNLYVKGDLGHPFFPDPQTSRLFPDSLQTTLSSLEPQWCRFRSEINREAITALYAALHAARPDLPLFIETRVEVDNSPDLSRYRATYAAWLQPDNLPTLKEVQPMTWRLVADGPQIDPLRFSETGLTPARTALLSALETARDRYKRPDAPHNIAIDLEAVSLDRALALLNECIVPIDAAHFAAKADGSR